MAKRFGGGKTEAPKKKKTPIRTFLKNTLEGKYMDKNRGTAEPIRNRKDFLESAAKASKRNKVEKAKKKAREKEIDKNQKKFRVGGALKKLPGPHKVDVNRRATESLLGRGKIQEKIIKFADKVDKKLEDRRKNKKASGGRVDLKKGTPKPKKTFRQEEQKGMALDRVMSRPYNPKDTFKDYVNRTRAMGGNVRTAAEMEKSISAAKSAKKSDKRVRKANGGRTNYRGGGLATSGYGKVMKS